jgi:hypothetical protein
VSYFTLTLDTTAPANPSLLINGGAATTADQIVQVALASPDYGGGARDVTQVKLWGDVDPTGDPLVRSTEDVSSWQAFSPEVVVKLSAGSGRKRIYARLRDDVCNETLVFSDFIDLDTDSPSVEITTAVDRSRISKTAPCDAATFAWQATHPFSHYEVRVVPTIGSPHLAGVVIPVAAGSLNVSGDGSYPAETPIVTVIRGADLEAASPGDTDKVIKVFVLDTNGVWSP